MNHTCEKIIISCIDFRFQKEVSRFAQSMDENEENDRVSIAGAVRDVEFLLKQIEISKRLHKIKEVCLLIHEDCGAYAQEGEYRQKQDMDKVEKEIRSRWPKMKVKKYWMILSGGWKEIIN